MGHRFSKTAAIRQNEVKRKSIATQKLISSSTNNTQEINNSYNRHSLPIPTLLGPAINFQIEESPTTTNRSYSSCSNNSNSTNNGARQIIIKIQLAKMENGNDTTIRLEQVQEMPTTRTETSTASETTSLSDKNSNLPNRTAGSSVITATTTSPATTLLNNSSCLQFVTANEQVTYSELVEHINAMQLVDIDELQQSTSRTAFTVAMAGTTAATSLSTTSSSSIFDNEDLEEYCEVLEEAQHNANNLENHLSAGIFQTHLCEEALLNTSNNNNITSNTNKCCTRKSRNSAATTTTSSASSPNSSSSTTGTTPTIASRRRCCKCTCRDALRRLMEPKYYKNKQAKANSALLQQQQQQQQPHSTELQWHAPTTTSTAASSSSSASTTSAGLVTPPYPKIPAEAIASLRNLPVVPAATTAVAATAMTTTNAAANVNVSVNSQLSIWASNPLNRQFVVVSCPPTSVLTVGRVDDNSIHLMATEDIEAIQANNNNNNTTVAAPAAAPADVNNSISQTTHAGPTVHSQVDYMHCLVPDLEKIINSSFYWGKMDRYEAERLLEGKPEGTFLLRDSAQEEFLFSVTFRKYGRSLHARIEQSGHKFSFDCHDPCVFTARTVTGLLEHYKDPSCVMFFEPMLTIPLHRKTTFSLQQLCRATIVSNITYDGINKLELPLRLKSYLKEYHYKQKLRIKPMDDPLYSCT